MSERREHSRRTKKSGRTKVKRHMVRRGMQEKSSRVEKAKGDKDPRKRAAAGAVEGGEKGYRKSEGSDNKTRAKETGKGAAKGAIDEA